MKIKMLSTAAGPHGVFSAGVEYPGVPEELAQQFIKGKAAIEVKDAPAPKPQKPESGAETASVAPKGERATDKAAQPGVEKAVPIATGKERPAAGPRR